MTRMLTVLDSDNIAAVGYDWQNAVLDVAFHGSADRVYSFHNVSIMEFAQLVSAESIGVHFAKHIKGAKQHAIKSTKAPDKTVTVVVPPRLKETMTRLPLPGVDVVMTDEEAYEAVTNPKKPR